MSEHIYPNLSTPLCQTRSRARWLARCVLALGLIVGAAATQAAESPNGAQVTVPNGYLHITTDDLKVQSGGGAVSWTRSWNGREWKFNPQWESLSQSWKNLTGSKTADTSAGSSGTPLSSTGGSTSSSDGCWVMVDEDWQPSTGTVLIGGVPQAGPMVPVRTTPFNLLMGEASGDYPPVQRVSVDYASLCMGAGLSAGAAVRDTEGIRKQNQLYLGEDGRYAYNNRTVLEKRSVKQLPPASAATMYASLQSGTVSTASVSVKGFRWIDKGSDWIDYNTQGQVVAWGDKNDNVRWLWRDAAGIVRGVVDGSGHVLYSLHYKGELVAEVRDYGVDANDVGRVVKYDYDSNNRLSQVTDARGYFIKYGYDERNRVIKITDQEGQIETLSYNGDMVKQRIAPDQGVTDYVFEYDDVNKLFSSKITGPQTAAGRRVEEYAHNRVSQLVRRVVNGRIEQEVRHDTGARVKMETDARGFTTRTTTNEFDQTVEIAYPDGAVQKLSYSAVHLGVQETTDALGFKTRYIYDDKANLAQKIEALDTPEQRVTMYEVNGRGQLIKLTVKGRTEKNGFVTLDAVTTFDYDALGQLKKVIDPEAFESTYHFDHAGNLATYTDGNRHTTTYRYDGANHMMRETVATKPSTVYTYDKVGRLATITDKRSKVTRTAYDVLRRTTIMSNDIGGGYTLEYNPEGMVVAHIDADGKRTEMEYDNFLDKTKLIDPAKNVTGFGYTIADGSANGQAGSLHLPVRTQFPTFVAESRFDALNRLTSNIITHTNQQGQQIIGDLTAYDKRGQIISTTDANVKERRFKYNALGQLVESLDALKKVTRFSYDVRGNLIEVIDANNHPHGFEYDRNNRMVKETFALGQSTVHGYDGVGNVAFTIDRKKNKTTRTYDEANRPGTLTEKKEDGTLIKAVTFGWDDNGNLTSWDSNDALAPVGNRLSSAILTYDDENRKTKETLTYPNGSVFSYGYAYTKAGRKSQIILPDTSVIGYTYTDHGEMETVTIPGEGVIQASQFRWRAPVLTSLPGGATQTRAYDGLLQMESLLVNNAAAQSSLSMGQQYGKLQEPKTSTRTDSTGGASSTISKTYIYDDENRLTSATTDTGALLSQDIQTFTVDPVGNRIAHSRQGGDWEYDANNQLIRRGTGVCGANTVVCYSYDVAGNVKQKIAFGVTVNYFYNSGNQLVQVENGAGKLIARYGYDPLRRRIWKEQFRSGSDVALTPAKRTYFLYSDEGLISEMTQDIVLNADNSVVSNGAMTILAQYGQRPNAPFTTATLFIKVKNSNAQEVVAYYHNDHLGTPIQATDKAGNVVWAASYDPFGKAQITTPAATSSRPTIRSNLRLPGQYEDEETGLHYNFHRDYDAQTGRYLQSDPIGLNGGINAYAYVGGNPVGKNDPLGLKSVEEYLAEDICGSDNWFDALNKAKNGKMGNFDPNDPFDDDNRTAAEHYIFGRYLAAGEGGRVVQVAYVATGMYWGYGYQGAKQVGLFPKASPPSYAQLYWEEKAWTDSVGLTKTFPGGPGGSGCACKAGQ
ncbi:MAG: RHS repeat-associated core domain-containing protein [Pseudomonadota bacterium]